MGEDLDLTTFKKLSNLCQHGLKSFNLPSKILIQMMLIAESGSTKTEWVLADDHGKEVMRFETSGFNVYIQKLEQIMHTMDNEVFTLMKGRAIDNIFFYGASCSSEENVNRMHAAISTFFPDAHIEINHDILAAARSLFGDGPGIAAILGTGSNSIVYDGKTIVADVPSVGYVMGDEGSGGYLGKRLLRDYIYRILPVNISKKLDDKYHLTKDEILSAIYRGENPNKWLASFGPFVSENIHEDYFKMIVKESFTDFFEFHIKPYEKYKSWPLSAVGSVGFYFRDILKVVADEYGFKLTDVIKKPVDGLMKYHLKEL